MPLLAANSFAGHKVSSFYKEHSEREMVIKIQQQDDDLVIPIPQILALQAGLEPDSLVDIALYGERLIVSPVGSESTLLETLTLVNEMADEDRHAN